MAVSDPEVTVICIDNSTNVLFHRGVRAAQREAISLYCKTKLKCNSENTVALMTTSTSDHRHVLLPTRNLPNILSSLQRGCIRFDGETEFTRGLYGACSVLSETPPHMKRRVLMFVGGPINLHMGDDRSHGANLKRLGTALDVVNFFILDLDYEAYPRSCILTDKYRYARKELGELVAAVNVKNNSHIVDVADTSSVVEILSDSPILKNNLHYLEKKADADAVKFVQPESKNKSVAADDEHVQAPGTKYGERYSAKNTPHIDLKIREDLSRRPGQSQNEKKPLQWIDKNRFHQLQNLENVDHM